MWSSPARDPIWGPEALRNLAEIKEKSRKLAAGLARDVAGLLYERPSQRAEKVPDPSGVGPRYMLDLREGYVAVFWVLPPDEVHRGAGPALWVEQVRLRSDLEAALIAMAPSDE